MRSSLTLCVLALSMTFATGVEAQSAEDDVRGVMQRFMTAALARDGSTVAGSLSDATVAAYDRFRELALSAEREQLESLGPYELFSVLHLRHRLDAAEIAAHSGRELLARSYDEGWNSQRALETVRDLGKAVSMDVEIQGNAAKLQMKVGDQLLPPPFPLVRERGRWNVDMAALFPHFEAMLQNLVDEKEASADRVVLGLLQAATGERPDPEIWSPSVAH